MLKSHSSNSNMASCLRLLCLDLIVQDFERFHFAFTTSNDEVFQQNSEVLQREFSSELVSSLSTIERLKDEFLDFLLNEHVTYLHRDFFKVCNFPIKDILCRLPNITELFLNGYCSNEILENVAKFCPKLVLIDATSSPLTGKGVKYLCQDENGKVPCPELKILGLRRTKVRFKDIKYVIENLPSIEILDCPAVPEALNFLHKRHLPKLDEGYSHNLTELNLFHLYYKRQYKDILKVCLTACPKLKSVACCIKSTEQFSLLNNTRLEKLRIRFLKSCKDVNINNFLEMNGSNLVYLNIYSCALSISDLAVNCPKLKELHLKKVTFLDDEDSQPVFDCLFKIIFNNINDPSTENKAIRLLLSSPKLESVSFRHCDLSAESQTHILKFCEKNPIKVITFEGIFEINLVKDILISCSSLRNLYLIGKKISKRDKKELNNLVETLPNKPCIMRNRSEYEKFLPGSIFEVLKERSSSKVQETRRIVPQL